jgi:hypothetical protein
MKLEEMEPCSVSEAEFKANSRPCKKCMMYIVCSTAMSPDAVEIIAKARGG